MSYRCEVCEQQVPERLPRLTYLVMRRAPYQLGMPLYRTEIAREIPVCRGCHDALTLGIPLAELLKKHRKIQLAPAPRFVVTPPPRPVSLGVPVKIV